MTSQDEVPMMLSDSEKRELLELDAKLFARLEGYETWNAAMSFCRELVRAWADVSNVVGKRLPLPIAYPDALRELHRRTVEWEPAAETMYGDFLLEWLHQEVSIRELGESFRLVCDPPDQMPAPDFEQLRMLLQANAPAHRPAGSRLGPRPRSFAESRRLVDEACDRVLGRGRRRKLTRANVAEAMEPSMSETTFRDWLPRHGIRSWEAYLAARKARGLPVQ